MGKAKTETKPKHPMPKFAKSSEEMVSFFDKVMKDFPMATQRKMFGCPCVFVNGNLFAGLFEEEMFLRLNDEDRLAIRKEYGTQLFEPMPGRPMREYVMIPHYVRNSPRLLKSWLTKGMEHAQALPPKVKKTRAKKD
jgi:TfoX/Sxy family transcriptional regulator of competence genes